MKCGYNVICLFWCWVDPWKVAVILKQSCCWLLVYAATFWLLWKGVWWRRLNTFCILSPDVSFLRFLFFSPSPFLVSNKVFAAVITRVINCTAYSNLVLEMRLRKSALSFHLSCLKSRVCWAFLLSHPGPLGPWFPLFEFSYSPKARHFWMGTWQR